MPDEVKAVAMLSGGGGGGGGGSSSSGGSTLSRQKSSRSASSAAATVEQAKSNSTVKSPTTKRVPRIGGSKKCPRCAKSVFFSNEVKSATGESWHKECFTCVDCKKKLDSDTAQAHESEIYCRLCLKKKSGGTVGTSGGGTRKVKVGGAMKCTRCAKPVYFGDEVKGADFESYHRKCFACYACKKTLDAETCAKGTDGEQYCRSCHRSKFSKHATSSSAAKTLTVSSSNLKSPRGARSAGSGIKKSTGSGGLKSPRSGRKSPRSNNGLKSPRGGSGSARYKPSAASSNASTATATGAGEKLTGFALAKKQQAEREALRKAARDMRLNPSAIAASKTTRAPAKKAATSATVAAAPAAAAPAASSSSNSGGTGPSCSTCFKALEGTQSINVNGFDFHTDCFQCGKCKKSLVGYSEVVFIQGSGFCKRCARDGFVVAMLAKRRKRLAAEAAAAGK